jgi:hypothetical protein
VVEHYSEAFGAARVPAGFATLGASPITCAGDPAERVCLR